MQEITYDANGVSEFSKLTKILSTQYKKQGLQSLKNSLNYFEQNPKAQPPKVKLERDEIIGIWKNYINSIVTSLKEKQENKNKPIEKSNRSEGLYRI